jgi:hypothetical protein
MTNQDLDPGHLPSINEPPGSNLGSVAHTVTSIDPAEAAIGDDDLTLHVYGSGFRDGDAQIVFNGGPETTVFVSDTELTTVVKPSTAGTPGSYPVTVAQAGVVCEPPQMFEFTEADEPVARRKRR